MYTYLNVYTNFPWEIKYGGRFDLCAVSTYKIWPRLLVKTVNPPLGHRLPSNPIYYFPIFIPYGSVRIIDYIVKPLLFWFFFVSEQKKTVAICIFQGYGFPVDVLNDNLNLKFLENIPLVRPLLLNRLVKVTLTFSQLELPCSGEGCGVRI